MGTWNGRSERSYRDRVSGDEICLYGSGREDSGGYREVIGVSGAYV
jgi:hypothetical protein